MKGPHHWCGTHQIVILGHLMMDLELILPEYLVSKRFTMTHIFFINTTIVITQLQCLT